MHRALALGVVFVLGIIAGSQSAFAFSLTTHGEIVRAALGDGNTIGQHQLEIVVDANLGSDTHQFMPEQHFDDAPNGAVICRRWQDGLNSFMNEAVRLSAPKGDFKEKLADEVKALNSFGRATHAIEDFVSHTNWIEAHGNLSPAAALLGQTCDPTAFKGIQSGYFELSARNGASGCPHYAQEDGTVVWQPPTPYLFCHEIINKDSPDTIEGRKGMYCGSVYTTYFQCARNMAIELTKALWESLHDRIVAKYQNDETDGECLFMKLAWSGDRTCQRRWVTDFTVTIHPPRCRGGPGTEGHAYGALHLSWDPQRYPGPNVPPLNVRLYVVPGTAGEELCGVSGNAEFLPPFVGLAETDWTLAPLNVPFTVYRWWMRGYGCSENASKFDFGSSAGSEPKPSVDPGPSCSNRGTKFDFNLENLRPE